MSKYVKQLMAKDIEKRLGGVSDALLVNVIGLDTDKTYALRKKLREKNIQLMVVKNSLARLATKGTSLAPAFEGLDGSAAVLWGSTDFVQLAKELIEIQKDPAFEKLTTRGGVLDKERLTPEKVTEVSKWPSRAEQLSMLVGQILGPGAQLASQLTSVGGALASQIKQKSEGDAA